MMKRSIDLLLSVVAMVILSPLIGIVAWRVRTELGRPVIFRQLRPGLDGLPFEIVKFRTMSNVRNSKGELMSDSARLSKFGRFLRSTSLDELPELWNVFRGDMSLVGPRPLLMGYLDLYSQEQARRHEVRPGITGWAQVNGRNALTWEERFDLDVWYVDNQSLWLDFKILWLTLGKVLTQDGISQDGHATMEPFKGTRD